MAIARTTDGVGLGRWAAWALLPWLALRIIAGIIGAIHSEHIDRKAVYTTRRITRYLEEQRRAEENYVWY